LTCALGILVASLLAETPVAAAPACEARGTPLAAVRAPETLVSCRVADDPVQQAWVGRAATRLGKHDAAAVAWRKVGADPALRGLANRERLLSLARAGKASEALQLVGAVTAATSPEDLALVTELALLGKERLTLTVIGAQRTREVSLDLPAALAWKRSIALGDASGAAKAARRLQLEAPGSPDERALGIEGFPADFTPSELARRWQRAQTLGAGELAGNECAAWFASLPEKAGPEVDDAIVTCAKLTSLVRHPVANDVLTRATIRPKTADAAWLGIARLRARPNDLAGVEEACTRVAKKSKERPECVYLSAILRLRAGDADAAKKHLTTLEKESPKSPKVREGWLQFVAHHFDSPGTVPLLQKLAKSARDPVAKAEVAYWLGRAAKKPAEARKQWGIALAADPIGYFGLLAATRLGLETEHGTCFPEHNVTDVDAERMRQAGFLAEARTRANFRGKDAIKNARALLDTGNFETLVRAGILAGGETRWPWNETTLAAFPAAFPDEVRGVDTFRHCLLLSLMRRESLFDPDVTSFMGARGLVQLMPKTAARLSTDAGLPIPTSDDLAIPAVNIDLADRYLALLLERFTHPLLAAAAYNAGPNAVLEWLGTQKGVELDLFVERIPYRETRLYVRAVGAALAAYTRVEMQGKFPAIPMTVPAAKTTGVDY